MEARYTDIHGLSDAEVEASRATYGANRLSHQRDNGFWIALKSVVKEPMVVLLFLASAIYFLSGETGDGLFLASAIVLVATISIFQDSRSRIALAKLKDFTQPTAKAIRNGITIEIKTDDIVVGDYVIVEEGTAIPADGTIIQSNDFSVDESVLTGESMTVYKDSESADPLVYMGTHASTGLAVVCVTEIGNRTKLGKLGKQLEEIDQEKTPLEVQIGSFVKRMVIGGAVVFAAVWAINYTNSKDVLDSFLKALTLAMSILPEEIPVAFTTFMALGAWRLMKMGIVVKHMKTVETLGSATVICTDKTGTLTENKMSIAALYLIDNDVFEEPDGNLSENAMALIRLAMWASEPIPFDPMEVSIHNIYGVCAEKDERPAYHMVHEYPLGGKPPMMTHVFANKEGDRIIASKGAPEAFLEASDLSDDQKSNAQNAVKKLAGKGYRILGVAEASLKGNTYPEEQQDIHFDLKGLVAFYDPPKANIGKVLEQFDEAGINVRIITGDNELTTVSIAKQIGFRNYDKHISGTELMGLDDKAFDAKVQETFVFTRMFPEAKLRIVKALKASGEIVAMTGDGVNDAPALKSAHIGIAMGKRGTEIAKQAASLILLEDDLSKMTDAIAMGRRIYTNLKKAIQYIISIHIPIILAVLVPLALGWKYPNIFTPVHVIFLELIMGPTCSIIYENEPIEKGTMRQSPRPYSQAFFSGKEWLTSLVQGLVIALGVLMVYRYATFYQFSEDLTRTMVFVALIFANITLTLVNRSFYYSIFTTLKYKNNLVPAIIAITLVLTFCLVYVDVLATFFDFESLDGFQLAVCFMMGTLSVIWFEIAKWIRRRRADNQAVVEKVA